MPDSLKIKYLPPRRECSNRWFDYQAVCAMIPGGFEVKREMFNKGDMVEVRDYAAFKTALQEAFFLLKEEIILEKTDEEKEGF